MTDEHSLLAALKAAAWALVAALGYHRALEALGQIKSEIENAQWGGPRR